MSYTYVMTDYTIDDFLGGKIRLKQPKIGLRATSDAVLLSAVCHPKKGETVLDVGCGTGVVALCIGAGQPEVSLTGIEIQSDLAQLAEENALLNNLQLKVVKSDIRQKALLKDCFFHHILTNPPFYTEDPKRQNESQEIAYKEQIPLKEWILFCLKHLRPKGTFSIIHRVDAVPEILSVLQEKLGALTLIPIWPKEKAQPKRVIIQGVLGSKKPFRIHPGIVLHHADNTRTEMAEAIMRQGEKIFL